MPGGGPARCRFGRNRTTPSCSLPALETGALLHDPSFAIIQNLNLSSTVTLRIAAAEDARP